MEKDLKELLIMFKTEQDYAERKNQIIFALLAIMISIFAGFINKLSIVQLASLAFIFLFIIFTALSSFFPQGKEMKPFSWIINWLMNRYAKKYKKKDDNYLNYANWKNFELGELLEAMEFFSIPINKINQNTCEQILVTSKLIYLKYLYFQYLCILLSLGVLIIILVLVFTK